MSARAVRPSRCGAALCVAALAVPAVAQGAQAALGANAKASARTTANSTADANATTAPDSTANTTTNAQGANATEATTSATPIVPVASGALTSETDDAAPLVRDESRVTHGMAEMGVGLLTLPGAEVCIARKLGCSKGDTSLTLSGWPLFRRGRFAAGAGVTVGLTSSTDSPPNDTPDIPRDHTRRYFSVEITGRYYAPFTERFEGWVGVTTGLGVVNDSFQSQKGITEVAVAGPRSVTLLTEGYTIGLGVGVAYAIATNWRFGGGMRVSSWFLPNTPARDPLGDEASLKGRVTTVELGLTLAYRSRLVF